MKHEHGCNDRLDVRNCFLVNGCFLKFGYQQKLSASRNILRKTGDLANHLRKLPICVIYFGCRRTAMSGLNKLRCFSPRSSEDRVIRSTHHIEFLMVSGRLKISKAFLYCS